MTNRRMVGNEEGIGMRATEDILAVWRRFDRFPMETLTKAWYFSQRSDKRQRTVPLMREHREEFGTSGNCFDLALWLIDEFRSEGIKCYAVGHGFLTPKAHVAVVAVNGEGYQYYCDLGDQWIQPILIDRQSEEYTEEVVDSFFPAAGVRVRAVEHEVEFKYIRPSGKERAQRFDLTPIVSDELVRAGEYSQNLLRHPLVETRKYLHTETQHWEFNRWKSFTSTNEGLLEEPQLMETEEWVERIFENTGIHRDVVRRALEIYAEK